MGVSKNRGTPKSSILIGFSIIDHPFWGYPYFWKHPYWHMYQTTFTLLNKLPILCGKAGGLEKGEQFCWRFKEWVSMILNRGCLDLPTMESWRKDISAEHSWVVCVFGVCSFGRASFHRIMKQVDMFIESVKQLQTSCIQYICHI